MKKILCAGLFSFFLFSAFAQPGKYAGSKKTLVGKMYSRDIPGLTGWEVLGGSVLSPLDDPEWFLVEIFKKGTTRLIIFSIREDTTVQENKIIDVVEVKNVLTTQEIITGVCRENKTENSMIVALIKPRNIQYNKAIKAWGLNRDKRRVELVPAVKVDCLHEGFDQM